MPKQEIADIDWEDIKHETEKAYLFVINGKDVWLPKSVCEIDFRARQVSVPYRIAFDRGLI